MIRQWLALIWNHNSLDQIHAVHIQKGILRSTNFVWLTNGQSTLRLERLIDHLTDRFAKEVLSDHSSLTRFS